MNNDQKLRNHLVKLLEQGNAFTPLLGQLNAVPYENTGLRLEGFAHTIWELTEHIRLALHDLVEYSKNSYYQSPPWPDGYWPENAAPGSRKEWSESIEHIDNLLNEMVNMVKDTSNDLFEPFKANAEHNLLRQATIAAEHAAYHGGQIVTLHKALQRLQD